MKAIALTQLRNEDWKTQMAKGYGDIPQGAEVEYIEKIKNMYGEFALVEYNGINYYVDPRYIGNFED